MQKSPSYETNQFSSCQEIPTICGTQRFITVFTSACHLSIFWSHTSGSIQVRGTSVYFITYVFMVKSTSHPTQPLNRSTTPCRLSVTAYSIYLRLPSILEAVRPVTTKGGAMLSWQGHTNLSWLYCIIWWIYYNKWFRSCIVSVYNKHYCFLSSWYASFLGSSGNVTYHASHLPLQILCFKSITIVL
jgi:hypothetical protein